MTTQRQMDALNTENHRQDNAIEVLVHWVVFGLLITGILLVLAYQDEIDCWFSPGTDTCVQCIDDCLEPMEQTKVELVPEFVFPEIICSYADTHNGTIEFDCTAVGPEHELGEHGISTTQGMKEEGA